MKTTLDLPSDLVREMKLRAVNEGRKFKDVAEEVFRKGLAQKENASKGAMSHRIALPLFHCSPDAPASRMHTKELLGLEQESQIIEDHERLK